MLTIFYIYMAENRLLNRYMWIFSPPWTLCSHHKILLHVDPYYNLSHNGMSDHFCLNIMCVQSLMHKYPPYRYFLSFRMFEWKSTFFYISMQRVCVWLCARMSLMYTTDDITRALLYYFIYTKYKNERKKVKQA